MQNFATTFSLVYQGYQTGRWSYTYSNDLNGDGNSSDLMYIPATADEIEFADIQGNDCLMNSEMHSGIMSTTTNTSAA